MWKQKQVSLYEIGVEGVYTIATIPKIDPALLPTFYEKERKLQTKDGKLRTLLHIESHFDHGSYGNIYGAKRGETLVLLKQPRMVEIHLLQEAVLQHLAFKTLEAEGISWAVPKVYDIFQRNKEVWFSMELIHGLFLPEWFAHTSHPDQDVYFLLAQICSILITLEMYLNLDHRDLKSNNLLLRNEPCTMILKLGENSWKLQCPFKITVLDFGFACLGSESLQGIPLVNLGDGVLPPMDPCPKEGRDIFHLFVSLLGIPVFRERISKDLHEKIDSWLSVGNKSYGTMARRWSTENWSYLVSSQPNFSIPSCCPNRILHDILPNLKEFLGRA